MEQSINTQDLYKERTLYWNIRNMKLPKLMDKSSSSGYRDIVVQTELPTDEAIKESLKEIYNVDIDTVETEDDETDSDLSDCDSDVDGMENLWDALIRSAEPYENTITHLNRILEALPRRVGTRCRKEPERFDRRIHNQMEKNKVENILNSHLVEPDVDQEVLMENLDRMRTRIKKIINKKRKVQEQSEDSEDERSENGKDSD